MLRILTAGLAVAALFLGLIASTVAQEQDDAAIGIDASPVGNAASSLGEIDPCVEVTEGDSLQVDVFIRNVEDLLAWEAYLFFDSDLLMVTGRDVQFFQAADEGSSVFDASESTPDDDGRYRVGGADIADPPSPESGSGVLGRLTLRALAPGTAKLSIAPVETDIGTIGPFLRDAEGSLIGDIDGDSFFDGPIVDAEVRIDDECPGGGAPPVLETPRTGPDNGGDSEDADDTNAALWIGLGVGISAVVLATGVGVYLWSRRRAAGGPDDHTEPDVNS